MEVLIQVECRISEDRDIAGFVSYCPAFEVYSQGATFEEALEAIKSALRLTLGHAFSNNRFESMLHKALQEHEAHISVKVHEGGAQRVNLPVAVPLSLLAAEANANADYSSRPV